MQASHCHHHIPPHLPLFKVFLHTDPSAPCADISGSARFDPPANAQDVACREIAPSAFDKAVKDAGLDLTQAAAG